MIPGVHHSKQILNLFKLGERVMTLIKVLHLNQPLCQEQKLLYYRKRVSLLEPRQKTLGPWLNKIHQNQWVHGAEVLNKLINLLKLKTSGEETLQCQKWLNLALLRCKVLYQLHLNKMLGMRHHQMLLQLLIHGELVLQKNLFKKKVAGVKKLRLPNHKIIL